MSAENPRAAAGELRARLSAQREQLFRLCYRMTGSAADADDLVQETYRRALENPPPDLERELRPWLVRVAVNLARDALRARKRRGYDGTWLPAPIETAAFESAEAKLGPEARYGELQSVTFAFMCALEALSPAQRAVLLLRDVLDYSVRETAAALAMSEPNVKTTLHRARRSMASYDASAQAPTPARQKATRQALEAFCMHLFARNVPALEALLARDVKAINDGGGEFFAARRPVLGRAKVIRFYLNTLRAEPFRYEIRLLNGLPALVLETAATRPRLARRVVARVELDAAGRIAEIDAIVATPKLSAVRFDTLAEGSLLDLLGPARSAFTHPPVAQWAPGTARMAVRGGLVRVADLARRVRLRGARGLRLAR